MSAAGLPCPLQQMLFETADSLVAPAPHGPQADLPHHRL